MSLCPNVRAYPASIFYSDYGYKRPFYVFSQKIIPGRNPCFNARDVVLVCCKRSRLRRHKPYSGVSVYPSQEQTLRTVPPSKKHDVGKRNETMSQKKSPSSKPRRGGGKTLHNFCWLIRWVFYIASPSSCDQPPVSSGHLPLVPPLRILTQLTLYLYIGSLTPA